MWNKFLQSSDKKCEEPNKLKLNVSNGKSLPNLGVPLRMKRRSSNYVCGIWMSSQHN